MKTFLQSLRVYAMITLVTGVLYPLAVTGLGHLLFREKANGSLVVQNGRNIGSALLAQDFESGRYFWPRPSAGGFATVASAASNLGPTSAKLKQELAERAARLREANHLPADAPLPPDVIHASGSGLDPHISPEAARLQIQRIAEARGIDDRRIAALVDQLIEEPELNVFGEPRINVLKLNLELDTMQ